MCSVTRMDVHGRIRRAERAGTRNGCGRWGSERNQSTWHAWWKTACNRLLCIRSSSTVVLFHPSIHSFLPSAVLQTRKTFSCRWAVPRCKIICSNFSRNLPWSSQVAEKRKKTEKINDPEDSVKNASLPYIIAIKKNNKMIKCKKFTLLRFVRSPPLAALQLVIYFTRMCSRRS